VKKGPTFTFQATREGIESRIDEMEKKIARLRALYESFFMGAERTPPNTLRYELNRQMLEMQQVIITNASLRFRYQALSQKWVLHTTYWNRTMREIDAGTYRRDIARTQRHLAERGGVITEEEALALGIPKTRVKAFVGHARREAEKRSHAPGATAPTNTAPGVAPSAASPPAALGVRSGPPPVPASARRSPSPEASALPGVAHEDFEGAYQHYIEAHRQLGIEAQAVTKDKLRLCLGKQLPKIMEEQNCQKVRLEVAVEDGKVRLRAWPAADKP
jgi:hypothetical protein